MATKSVATKTRHVEAPAEAKPDRELKNVETLVQLSLQSEREPEFVAARDQLLANVERMRAIQPATLEDAALAEHRTKAGQLAVRAATTVKAVEAERKRLKDPLTKAGKALDQRFGEYAKPVEGVREAAERRIRECDEEAGRRAAEAARQNAPEGAPIEGVVVEPPAPIRTAEGTVSVRVQEVAEIEDLRILAAVRPDLVEPRMAAILAELQAGKVVPGAKLGKREVTVIR